MNHHLESLGWTLLHFCWQATAIALVYWLADAVLAKARSQSRYFLALATMLLMLVSAQATFAYEETQGGSGLSSSTVSFSSPALLTIESGLSSDLAPSPGLKTAGAATQLAQLPLSRFLPWLDVAWLLGVALLSTRTIGGWRLIQRLRRSSLVAAPEAVSANFLRLCERLGITRQVSLRISQHIQGPLAIGIVRSLVILPASALMALSPEQLEAVLAHELAHVRRADYLWNLIQTMIETLFFFHPAVWWLGSRLRQQRELCCDDVAVESCADPLVYATALLRLEERRRQQLNLAMALDGHRPWSGLRVRIARILGEADGEKGRHDLVPIPLAAICAVFLLVVLPVPQLFAGLRETMRTQAEAPAASAAPAPTPAPAPAPDPAPASTPSPSLSHVVDDSSTESPTPALAAVGDDHVVVTTTATTTTSEDARGAGHGAGEGTGSGSGPDGSGSHDGNGGQTPTADASSHKPDYIDGMRAAGYDVDVDKYVAMKVQGITPEYAQAMAKVGFGKPSADDLIAMKVQGITPEYVSGLRAAGLEPSKISDLIAYRIFKVTPEYVAEMKAAGFGSIPPDQLVALRVQKVTPEFAKTVKQQYPNATIDELVKLRVFHIDDAFIADAKRHGFTSLSIEQLVRLRISGVMGDTDAEAK
jgi:beta-lactamase regulating signal transducer with metallopeptidase domain